MTTTHIPAPLEARWRHYSRRADRLGRLTYTARRKRLALRARLAEMLAWNALSPFWRAGSTLRAWSEADFASVSAQLEGLR